MILHILIVMVAGWIQRHQQQVISYLQEENHVLKAQLGGRQLPAFSANNLPAHARETGRKSSPGAGLRVGEGVKSAR